MSDSPMSPSALVIGEALIDVVCRSASDVVEHVGGSPANVALGLGRLGRSVRLWTALADDDHGRRIRDHLVRSGVSVDPASFTLARTSTAEARIGADGSASYRFDIDWRLEGELRLGDAAHVHVGSIACFLEPGASSTMRLLERIRRRVRISFDPNIRPALVGNRDEAVERVEAIAQLAHIVKLSDEDAAWLYPGRSIKAVLGRLINLGTGLAAATLGRNGAMLVTRATSVAVNAPPVTLRDTVGAGDSFTAGLLDALWDRDVPADAARLSAVARHAAAAAAVTVSRDGADLPDRAALERMRTGI